MKNGPMIDQFVSRRLVFVIRKKEQIEKFRLQVLPYHWSNTFNER